MEDSFGDVLNYAVRCSAAPSINTESLHGSNVQGLHPGEVTLQVVAMEAVQQSSSSQHHWMLQRRGQPTATLRRLVDEELVFVELPLTML